MSKFKGVKTNNAKTSAKREIRMRALESISSPAVLEVFCGAGEMYESVWENANTYLGIDKVKFFDKRNTICGDAVKAVSTIDLSGYNVFDIDAYGSPYEVLDIVTRRMDKALGEYYFVITDGVSMDLRLGRICAGLRAMTGIEFHVAKKAAVIHDLLIADVIKEVERRLNGVHSNFMIAKGKTGAAMKYYAFKVTQV